MPIKQIRYLLEVSHRHKRLIALQIDHNGT